MRSDYYFYFSFILISICYIFVVDQADFYFPIPWGDEALFFYPAKSFSENWSIFASEIHENRPVFWQPPGYYIICGLLFKVFGPTFQVFRAISLVFSVFSIGILLFLFRKASNSLFWFGSFLVLGMVLSRHYVVLGNMGRMEALVLFLSLLSFVSIYYKRYHLSIQMGLLALFMHPNGLFILFMLFLILFNDYGNLKFRLSYWVFGYLVIFGLYSYLFFLIINNYDGFKYDLLFQSLSRTYDSISTLILRPLFFIFILLWLFVFYFSIKKFRENRLFFLLQFLSLAFFMIRNIGLGLCYGVFNILAMCITIFQLIIIFNDSRYNVNKYSTSIMGFLVFSALYFISVFNIPLNGHSNWVEMDMPKFNSNYLTESEMDLLVNKINISTSASSRTKIYFFPEADGIFFSNHPAKKWMHFIRVLDDSKPDYYVIHYSTAMGNTVKEEADAILNRMRKENIAKKILIRNEKEYWILVKNCKSCLTDGRLNVINRMKAQN